MNKIVLVVTKLVAYLTSPTYTDEQIKFAYQLRQQGMTYKMIARKTGISERTQQRRFKDIYPL